MQDHDVIVGEAAKADATTHLAFTSDFSEFDEAIDNEVRLIEKLEPALRGTATRQLLGWEPTGPTCWTTSRPATTPLDTRSRDPCDRR
jgi:hypothetical protein